MLKKLFCLLTATTLLALSCFPIYAENNSFIGTTLGTSEYALSPDLYLTDTIDLTKPTPEKKLLPFEIYIETAGQGPILYGKLPGIDKLSDLGASSIVPCYSMNGIDFFENPDLEWLESGSNKTHSKPCLYGNQEPLKSYLEQEIDEIWVKLNIVDGEYEGFSETARLKRSPPIPLPNDAIVYPARFPASMRESSEPPYTARYHVTVTQGTTAQEIMKLLPQTIKPELQIQYGEYPMTVDSVPYEVAWNITEDISKCGSGEEIIKNAAILTPPNTAVATINDIQYSYEPPQIIGTLNLVVTILKPNTPAEIEIYENIDAENLEIWSQISPKPTGATGFRTEYSIDGGVTWIDLVHTEDDYLFNLEHIDKIPKINQISTNVGFEITQSPIKEYLLKELPGFMVRLQITGGALEGYTKSANWPSTYEYIKPEEGGADGSGGNRGDAGSPSIDGDGTRTESENTNIESSVESNFTDVGSNNQNSNSSSIPEATKTVNDNNETSSNCSNTSTSSNSSSPYKKTDTVPALSPNGLEEPQKSNSLQPYKIPIREHKLNYFSIAVLSIVALLSAIIIIYKTKLLKKSWSILKKKMSFQHHS